VRENALLVRDTELSRQQFPEQEGISEMNATSTRIVVVEAGGTQVVGHVGLHALGAFADRLGVAETLSQAVGWTGPGRPVHDRGRVLCHAMLMLAGGGESCSDIEALASQSRLFGAVCSDTTLYRTFTENLDDTAVEQARRAMVEIRTEVWRRTSLTDGDTAVILDLHYLEEPSGSQSVPLTPSAAGLPTRFLISGPQAGGHLTAYYVGVRCDGHARRRSPTPA